MKKYLFSIFVMVLATMVGCQKSDVDGLLEESNNSANKITVTADIANDGQTRVALTPGTDNERKPIVKVDWNEKEEEFDVFIMNSEYNCLKKMKFVQIEGTNQFSSTTSYDGEYHTCLAYYPSGIVSHNGTFNTNYDIFKSQDGRLSEERTFMGADAYALNENTKFKFNHLTTLLMPKFRVQGATENLSPANIQTITFKSMSVNGETPDFVIDCTRHGEKDHIYVYLPQESTNGKNKIEVVVKTRDAKTYNGEIDLSGKYLQTGKLYTANIWLNLETTISYTTKDGVALKFDNVWFKEHKFENGVGTIVLNDTTVPNDAFATQATLQTVTLSSEITKIGAKAFKSCSALTTVTMPGVTEIGEEAFNMQDFETVTNVLSNQLSNIDLSKVTKFGTKALYKVSLSEIDLSSATEIGEKAFAEMYNLESVTMPEQDCKIGKYSFALCRSLTTIDLTNVSNIGEKAFQKCTELVTVFINRESIPTVGNTPFDGCTGGLMILVPDNLFDQYAGISGLSNYIVRTAITYTTTNDAVLTLSNAWGEGDNCVYKAHVFANGVGKIVLKDGVTTLPANAFKEQSTLKSFVLPMQITAIGDSAFQQCCYLESISMPNVTVIGAKAFCMSGCDDILDKLKITHLDLSNVREIGEEAFRIAASITSVDVSSATNIGARAFFELGKLTSIIMPAKGSNCVLGESVFGYSNSFTTIDLSGVIKMGAMQFDNWYGCNPQTIIIDRETPPTIVAKESDKSDKSLWNKEFSHTNPNIYVPKVETYKEHSDWSQYKDNIKPLSELPK